MTGSNGRISPLRNLPPAFRRASMSGREDREEEEEEAGPPLADDDDDGCERRSAKPPGTVEKEGRAPPPRRLLAFGLAPDPPALLSIVSTLTRYSFSTPPSSSFLARTPSLVKTSNPEESRSSLPAAARPLLKSVRLPRSFCKSPVAELCRPFGSSLDRSDVPTGE